MSSVLSPAGQTVAMVSSSAQRIRFVDKTTPHDVVIMEFRDPSARFAISEPVAVQNLPPVEPDLAPEGVFYFQFLSAGVATPFEQRQGAEEWMAKPSLAGSHDTIELLMQSDRILWRSGRALVIGAPERMNEILLGLIEFSFYEGELRRMEREINEYLYRAEKDIPLTHQVHDNDISRWPNINAMTEIVTLFRMQYVRLESHLEKASVTLSGATRRMVSELIIQDSIADRLKSLDDRLEVLEDLYELANDRLSEYSYFRKEYRLEVGIIVVLVLEILAILWEIFVLS